MMMMSVKASHVQVTLEINTRESQSTGCVIKRWCDVWSIIQIEFVLQKLTRGGRQSVRSRLLADTMFAVAKQNCLQLTQVSDEALWRCVLHSSVASISLSRRLHEVFWRLRTPLRDNVNTGPPLLQTFRQISGQISSTEDAIDHTVPWFESTQKRGKLQNRKSEQRI